MKRALLVLYCAIIIILPACTVPSMPLVYADIPARTDEAAGSLRSPRAVPLTVSESVELPSPAPRPLAQSSPSPAPVPTPNVDDSFEMASEAAYGDEVVIEDFSVSPNGEAPGNPALELVEYPHYIAKNNARYRAFIAAFPHLPVSMSLALVNVNADFGYYNGITQILEPESVLVLCNKNFQLPEDYVPKTLRNVAGTDRKMTDEAASAFERMQQALRDELGLRLVVVSAYRSYHYQKTLYRRYAARDGAAVADTYSARAGHSEHQTGLAIDILHRWPSGSLRRAGFQNTAQYAWLQAHAHKYGYILRYPEGYEPVTGYIFESWHWRYIGVEAATRMFEEGIATFEEYAGTFIAGAPPLRYSTIEGFLQT